MQTLSDILGVIEPRDPAKREVALSRLAALRAAKDCPPAAVSGNPRSVTAPVGPLQSGGTSSPTTYEKVERMADLWMPCAVVEQASVDHLNHLCSVAWRRNSRHAESLHQARCAVMDRLRDTVGHIRDRGCLLHVNAPYFGGAK